MWFHSLFISRLPDGYKRYLKNNSWGDIFIHKIKNACPSLDSCLPCAILSKLHNDMSSQAAQDLLCVQQQHLDVTVEPTAQRPRSDAHAGAAKRIKHSWQPSGFLMYYDGGHHSRLLFEWEPFTLRQSCPLAMTSGERRCHENITVNAREWWEGLYLCGSGDCVRGFHFCSPPPCEGKTWNKGKKRVRHLLEVNARLLTKGFPPQHFLDTPTVHMSASTGPASPDVARVCRAVCLYYQVAEPL